MISKRAKLILIFLLALGWIFFPTDKALAWWDSNYQNRKKIYFANSSHAVDLTNFPVMVKLTSSNFDFTKVLTNGEDIRFVDGNDTDSLSYEIEYFSKAGESAVIWVEVPQIDASSNTDYIYLYYNYGDAVDGQDAAGTWSNNFEAVWHFGQDSGDYTDSTGNSHSSLTVSVGSRTNSCLGYCPSFNGSSHYINVPDSNGFDIQNYTISAYVRCDGAGVAASSGSGGVNVYPVTAKGVGQDETAATNVQWMFGVKNTNKLAADFEDDSDSGNSPVTITDTINCSGTTFYSVVNRMDDTNDLYYIYWDGALKGASSTTKSPNIGGNHRVGIGTAENTSGTRSGYWNGLIDELRIEKEARTPEWIDAQASSTNNTLLTYDTEESQVSTLTQSAYKWFANDDSTAVGKGTFLNQAITAPAQGSPFRLRLLLHVGGGQIAQSATTSLLQFAVRSGTCDTGFSGESFSSLSSTTGAIRYYNNPSATDGAALTANPKDPSHSGHTTRNQVYSEGSNNFSNSQSAISNNEDGLWDFALVDYSADPNTAYCFRAVQAGGGVLNTYSVVPEITTRKIMKVKLKGGVALRRVFLR